MHERVAGACVRRRYKRGLTAEGRGGGKSQRSKLLQHAVMLGGGGEGRGGGSRLVMRQPSESDSAPALGPRVPEAVTQMLCMHAGMHFARARYNQSPLCQAGSAGRDESPVLHMQPLSIIINALRRACCADGTHRSSHARRQQRDAPCITQHDAAAPQATHTAHTTQSPCIVRRQGRNLGASAACAHAKKQQSAPPFARRND